MSWPSGPPSMPPRGWYHDPEQQWSWRWWDGQSWTELRAPMWVAPVRDPRSFAAWFERSTACVKDSARRVGVVVASVWMALGISGVLLSILVYRSDRSRELRDILGIDDFEFGSDASDGQLTDDELERAWHLTVDIFWSTLPWLIALAVVFAIVSAWTYALVAIAARDHIDDPDGDARRGLGELAREALRRVPVVIASSVALGAIVLAALACAALPVFLVVIAGAGAATIVLTALFCFVAGSVAAAWLWGRLGLAVVNAAMGGAGVGLHRSWALSRGNYWFVVGRLLVAGLIASALGGAAGSFNGLWQLLGFGVVIVLFMVLNAVASAASTIVSVCAQVVIVDQVAEAPTGSPVQATPA